jgi:Integrase core domain
VSSSAGRREVTEPPGSCQISALVVKGQAGTAYSCRLEATDHWGCYLAIKLGETDPCVMPLITSADKWPKPLAAVRTLDIRPLSTLVWKQFTARDVVSRWDTVELGRRATAAAAADVLDRLAERMPFPVRAISIDNGSEFMAEFELACQARGIALFVLPPRSPKLHGAVERANRTHTEEFYEVTDAEPELEAFQVALRAWETVYNTIRPHQSLGQRTPAEFLASVGVEV